MAKQHSNHDQSEEVKFISPFISHSCEMKSSLSLEPKQCPSSRPKENLWAMDKLEAPTLELKRNDSTNEHESFSFESPCVLCSVLESLELIMLSATCFYEDPNLLLILVCKLFKRMVMDAFIYHKYCKSHCCTVALTLPLE
jgi:hypothetical protein